MKGPWIWIKIPIANIRNQDEEFVCMSDETWDWLEANCGTQYDDVKLTGVWDWELLNDEQAEFFFLDRSAATRFKLTWG